MDAERDERRDNQFMLRVITVGGLAVITIGFWGAIVVAGLSYDRQVVAFILIGAGGLLSLVFGLWGYGGLANIFYRADVEVRLQRIANFDYQLVQLDLELKKRISETKQP